MGPWVPDTSGFITIKKPEPFSKENGARHKLSGLISINNNVQLFLLMIRTFKIRVDHQITNSSCNVIWLMAAQMACSGLTKMYQGTYFVFVTVPHRQGWGSYF